MVKRYIFPVLRDWFGVLYDLRPKRISLMFQAQPYTQAMHDQCKALDDVKGGVTCKSNIPFDPSWKGNAKRWQAHCSGNLYALTVQNRSMDHTFTVHQYGKNAWQAGLRYYRGFTNYPTKGRSGWTWQCTKIVSAKLLTTK